MRSAVSDPLGAVIPHADVTLLRDNNTLARTSTNDLGEFVFSSLIPGRYRVRATALGFTEQESPDVYLGSGKVPQIVLSLKIGSVTQQVVVSATGTPAPDSQVGASVAVVSNVAARPEASRHGMRRARLEFGGAERVKEECRDRAGTHKKSLC